MNARCMVVQDSRAHIAEEEDEKKKKKTCSWI